MSSPSSSLYPRYRRTLGALRISTGSTVKHARLRSSWSSRKTSQSMAASWRSSRNRRFTSSRITAILRTAKSMGRLLHSCTSASQWQNSDRLQVASVVCVSAHGLKWRRRCFLGWRLGLAAAALAVPPPAAAAAAIVGAPCTLRGAGTTNASPPVSAASPSASSASAATPPLYDAIDGWVPKYVYTSTVQSRGKSSVLCEQLRTPRATICCVSATLIDGSTRCSVRTAISEMPLA